MKKKICSLLSCVLLLSVMPMNIVSAKEYTPYDHIEIDFNRDVYATTAELNDANNFGDRMTSESGTLYNTFMPSRVDDPKLNTASHEHMCYVTDTLPIDTYNSKTNIFTGTKATYKIGDPTSDENAYAAKSGGININQRAEKIGLLMGAGSGPNAGPMFMGKAVITYDEQVGGKNLTQTEWFIVGHMWYANPMERLYTYNESAGKFELVRGADKTELSGKTLADVSFNCLKTGANINVGISHPYAKAERIQKDHYGNPGSVYEVELKVQYPDKTIKKIEINDGESSGRIDEWKVFETMARDDAALKPNTNDDKLVSESNIWYAAAYAPVTVDGKVYYMLIDRKGEAILGATAIQKTLEEKIAEVNTAINALPEEFSEEIADKITVIRTKVNELAEYDVADSDYAKGAIEKLEKLEKEGQSIIKSNIERSIEELPTTMQVSLKDKDTIEAVKKQAEDFIKNGGEISEEYMSKLEALTEEIKLLEQDEAEAVTYKPFDLDYTRDVFYSMNFASSISNAIASNVAMNEDGIRKLSGWNDGVLTVEEVSFKFGPMGTEEENTKDKNALSSFDLNPIVINVEPGLYDKVYFIANSTDGSSDTAAEITYNYTDGTSVVDKNITTIVSYRNNGGLKAGEKADDYRTLIGSPGAMRPANANETGPGTYGGYIMKYACAVDTSKVLKSISIKANATTVYAVTGQNMKTRKTKIMLEKIGKNYNIGSISDKDRVLVSAFFNGCERIKDKVDVTEISGYNTMVEANKNLISIESIATKTDLSNNTVTVKLTGDVSAASVTKENVKLYENGNAYTDTYAVKASDDKIIVTFENKMNYDTVYSIELSDKIEGASGFAIGEAHKEDLKITAPVVINGVNITSEGSEVEKLTDIKGENANVSFDVVNNTGADQEFVAMVALFSADGEMYGRKIIFDKAEKESKKTASAQIEISENVGDGWHIECIIWNNYTNAARLFNTVTVR